ncbi:hypothetical protein PF008_g21256 [Phytophthora fragariae]|uniref:Uncharacterized protein n=1 Tax=Phytophthora fragariae TaxID=53985 RepID=A0A6G0QY61_9STRA|nr:hypothetical protein PF008_g21256 [Phytophthora fragariae]
MDAVEKPVEQAIGGEMPERFGQIFGGWTHSTEHYLAVYGYYGTDTRPPPPKYPLLSLEPVTNDPDDH